MKAYAYAGRLSDNDALDIWRLLQSASNAGHTAADWPTRSTARDAAVILHQHFATPRGGEPHFVLDHQDTHDPSSECAANRLRRHMIRLNGG